VQSHTEIAVLGSGLVTPFTLGEAKDVLARTAPVQTSSDRGFWPVPDEFRDRIEGLTGEVKRDKAAWMTAGAMKAACQACGADLSTYAPERVGLVLGCAFAGQLGMIEFADEVRAQTARFVSPIHFPQTVGNYVAGAMARAFKIRGPNLTVAAGAISGLQAITTACDLLAEGTADLILAGGVETLSEALVQGLGGSTFGTDNAGLYAEGACLYVLKRAVDVDSVSARIVGWTSTESCSEADTIDLSGAMGNSLAAESAARLAGAIHSGAGVHIVRHTHGNNTVSASVTVH
jgi:3-oxoacyl-[acyl-carrier-protein] synthase II